MTVLIGFGFFAFAAAVLIGGICLGFVMAWDWFHRRGLSEPDARLRLYEPARNVSHFASERSR